MDDCRSIRQVSLTNTCRRGVLFKAFCKLFIYIRKSTELSIEPCGTPILMGLVEDRNGATCAIGLYVTLYRTPCEDP